MTSKLRRRQETAAEPCPSPAKQRLPRLRGFLYCKPAHAVKAVGDDGCVRKMQEGTLWLKADEKRMGSASPLRTECSNT